ncbi:MAG: hypothetical protein IIC61_02830 [Proteobacteria bacterium]|nr:hypothetical protein [Pseudomonadota bacterium]
MTSKISARCLVVALAMGLVPVAGADDHRARINYMIHCQGCHLPEAVGFAGKVPRMKDFVGYFLHSKEGREFVIRVPGVATSSLPDDKLTEMMNWLLLTYSSEQLPEPFVPFSVAEVAALRPDLETNPEKTRMRILRQIAQELPSLAVELEQENGI